ncbi:MAG TPA: helix-turn-helix domain-containing protein [Ktedonobacteraceae bacterium]
MRIPPIPLTNLDFIGYHINQLVNTMHWLVNREREVSEKNVVKISRERDAEVAREAILEAAEEVFAREGFDGSRIDIIAAESGYNKSLIFHYFIDKEGLYRAVIKRMKMRMNGELLEPLTAFIESSDEMSIHRVRLILEMAIGLYLDYMTSHPRNLRIMAWETAEGWVTYLREPAGKESETYRASVFCIADFLRHAQEADVICKEVDVRFVVMNLMNMCSMYLLNLPRFQWFFTEAETDQQTKLAYIRQQIVQLVLYGIFTSSQEGIHK